MDIYRAKEVLELAKKSDDIKDTAVRVAIDIVLNATEYQLPKKPLPKETHKGFNNFCCPSCEKPLSNKYEEYELSYCDNCGQKLDWH